MLLIRVWGLWVGCRVQTLGSFKFQEIPGNW